MTNDELPEGWASVRLDELGQLQLGKMLDNSKNTGTAVPYLRNINVRWFRFDLTDLKQVRVSDDERERLSVKNGDLFICEGGEPGRCAVWREGTNQMVYQKALHRFRSNGAIIPEVLMHRLRLEAEVGTLHESFTGTTIKHLTRETLVKYEVPLPPLAEQKRIAEKLEAVLGRVDACRARLDRVPALLKRFRQSVLAAATSGQLTEEWREENDSESADHLVTQIASEQEAASVKVRGGKIEPEIGDLGSEIELPDKWAVAGFDALAEPIPNALKAGPFGSALKKDMYAPDGFKIYGQEQVIAGDENFGDYFIDQAKFDDLSSCAVKSGDILVSLVGTIGRVLILSRRSKPGIINPRLVKLSLHASINREFVAFYLRGPMAQTFFTSRSHGGTMDILNLGLLRELPILLPPLPEQQEIVRRVESLFTFADRIEARLSSAQKTVDRLTPAVLAKAFRGHLVPQDPTDEPASTLLERLHTPPAIKSTRAKLAKRS